MLTRRWNRLKFELRRDSNLVLCSALCEVWLARRSCFGVGIWAIWKQVKIVGTPRQRIEAWEIMQNVFVRFPVVEAFMKTHPRPTQPLEGEAAFVETQRVR